MMKPKALVLLLRADTDVFIQRQFLVIVVGLLDLVEFREVLRARQLSRRDGDHLVLVSRQSAQRRHEVVRYLSRAGDAPS